MTAAEKAQNNLDVATRKAARLEERRNTVRAKKADEDQRHAKAIGVLDAELVALKHDLNAAVERRDYLAQDPALRAAPDDAAVRA